ncbi:hypothetical protein ACSBR1_011552 [Camellia fascicularis]
MASILVVLLMFFILFAAIEAHKKPPKTISLGSSLSLNSQNNSWLSASGLFAFGFYPEKNGFAVGIWIVGHKNNTTVVWTANRDYPVVSSNAIIEFTTDGRLNLVHTEQGIDLPIADIAANARVVSASLLDSGNFVISNESSVIWESFGFPTDTILGGQTLLHGHQLVSSVSSSSDHSSGRYRISMQSDGNLVNFPVNQFGTIYAYWQPLSQLPGVNDYYNLILNSSGLLYIDAVPNSDTPLLILANGAASASSPIGGNNDTVAAIIYRATLDNDGIFRLYSHRFVSNTHSIVSTEWSALQDHCKVYNFCGFNSYCQFNSPGAECHCFPGFAPVDPSKKFMGCFMNFTEQRCLSKESFGLMDVATLENSRWGDYAYSVVPMKKEDCRKSCLEDGYCRAALYFSGKCNKHKLPLRYGIRNLSDSVTAFVKIRTVAATSTDQLAPASPSGPIAVTEMKGHLISILAASLGSLACLCIVIAISSFFLYRHRVHKYTKLSDNAKLGLTTEEFSLLSFSYNELEKATQGFTEELGKGSFGTVYKGALLSGGGNKNIVAVKRLENVVDEAGDREFQFQTEVTAIGKTHHRNLVRLLGFCVEGKRKLLVYEYMNNGSLADVLFKADQSRRPSWKERVKIVLDIARGILYLHEECEACIVHCGIKPQNILMDDSWTAKISDFGLAKLLLRNHMKNFTRRSSGGVTANPGSSYLAPEWQQQQQQQQRKKQDLISVKADIYSFGVVLLEVISCRRNIEINVFNEDEMFLCTWVYKCFVGGELHKLVVGDEEMRVDLKTLERMVKVGLWCIQDDPGLRPSIKNVIMMLEGTVNIALPPPPYPISLLCSIPSLCYP